MPPRAIAQRPGQGQQEHEERETGQHQGDPAESHAPPTLLVSLWEILASVTPLPECVPDSCGTRMRAPTLCPDAEG
jgi:hypothetical protein